VLCVVCCVLCVVRCALCVVRVLCCLKEGEAEEGRERKEGRGVKTCLAVVRTPRHSRTDLIAGWSSQKQKSTRAESSLATVERDCSESSLRVL
jgi:hypothetical protein